jgi:hypothetical protein
LVINSRNAVSDSRLTASDMLSDSLSFDFHTKDHTLTSKRFNRAGVWTLQGGTEGTEGTEMPPLAILQSVRGAQIMHVGPRPLVLVFTPPYTSLKDAILFPCYLSVYWTVLSIHDWTYVVLYIMQNT